MELAPEDKVNMSLDDLIKAKRLSAAAAKLAAPPAGAKKPRAKKPNAQAAAPNAGNRNAPQQATGAANKPKRKPRRGAGAGAMDIVPAVSQRVAQNLGEGKAKRAAAVDKRRGLNATGKPTRQQMDLGGAQEVSANRVEMMISAVHEAFKISAAFPRRQDRKKAALRDSKANGARPVSARQPVKNGLKISFKPADLNKTTDKSVALQIRAVLSKQRGDGGPGAKKGNNNGGIIGNSSRSVSSVGAGGNNNNGGGARNRGGRRN